MQLENLKIGDYALVLDLLGTAARMADSAQWLGALYEILTTVTDVLHETTDISDLKKSQPVYQYGDTFVFPSDDPVPLVALGCRLLSRWWERDILAQAGLSGGGVYFASELPARAGKPVPTSFKPQLLVGPAVARGHLAMRGLKGPRFVIDAEVPMPAPAGRWTYNSGKSAFSRPSAQGIVVKEIAWWMTYVSDLEAQVDDRVASLDSKIEHAKCEMQGSPVLPLWQRDIESWMKRKEHLLQFRACVADA